MWSALNWACLITGGLWIGFLSLVFVAIMRIGCASNEPIRAVPVPVSIKQAPWFIRRPVTCFLRGIDVGSREGLQLAVSLASKFVFPQLSAAGLNSSSLSALTSRRADGGESLAQQPSLSQPQLLMTTKKLAVSEPSRPPVKRREVPKAVVSTPTAPQESSNHVLAATETAASVNCEAKTKVE
jgi:hypothetical protein